MEKRWMIVRDWNHSQVIEDKHGNLKFVGTSGNPKVLYSTRERAIEVAGTMARKYEYPFVVLEAVCRAELAVPPINVVELAVLPINVVELD